VLRASAACELAGFPTTSLTCEGFLRQAAATSIGLGLRNIPLSLVPGHIGNKNDAQLRHDILETTLPEVIRTLTTAAAISAGNPIEPHARDIVAKGGFFEVNQRFYRDGYTDGLPIVPPTAAAIDRFLAFTPRSPDQLLGTMLPDRRAATVWNVAVNGVMAGCRPEHMPILVALVEAMADPQYGVEHSGNTPGADTLIILNGPIIKQLDFNYTQGALRDGFLPNTAVGRFWRLYLRNVAGFHLHKTDKATFGNTWRVVLAENEEVLEEIGWSSIGMDVGFERGDNIVTVSRFTGGGSLSSVTGSTPEELLPYLADSLQRFNNWQITFTTSHGHGSLRPLAVITPITARTLAEAGWSKVRVQEWLFEHVRLPAWEFERQLHEWNIRGKWNLTEDVLEGLIPKLFHESDDPMRMVPIVWKPSDLMIAVAGDPLRNNAYIFAHNGFLGFPTGKKIDLPADWDARLKEESP
jgi:hypothetical protein